MKTVYWMFILIGLVLLGCTTPAEPVVTDSDPGPVSTSVPTSTPAPALEAERVYLMQMDAILEKYAALWKEQATLLGNVDIDFESESWKADIDRTLTKTLAANQEIRDLHCPLDCWPIHEHMLNAADYYDAYVLTLVRALVQTDPELTLEAGQHSWSGSNEVTRAMDEAEKFRQAHGIE